MNEQQLQRSGRIASLITKALAVIGLAAILGLIAWVIVQGLRTIPKAGDDIGAAVTTVRSVFRDTSDAAVGFTLERYTYPVGEPTEVAWQYTGESEDPIYGFSYECEPGVLLAVKMGESWVNLACDTPLIVRNDTLTIRPTATTARFNDVTLYVTADGDTATTVVSVVNADIEANAAPKPLVPAPTPVTPVVSTPTPTPIKPVVTTPIVVRGNDPADLALSIEETGVLVDVAGRETFFPISPIPSDREAAVRFTVSNLGDRTTGAWKFTAYLPTEGDSDYKYTSTTQSGLLGGGQVEFTLGFDDILDASKGTIRITLDPVDSYDPAGNNTDSVTISIDN